MNNEKTERFELSIRTLRELVDSMEEKYGRKIDCLKDSSKGIYRFADREFNDVTVGIISFNEVSGKYNPVVYNPHFEEELKNRLDGFSMDKIKDLVLLNWANYTMNLITDLSYHSDNKDYSEVRDLLYTSFYIPIKMDEFNYSDAVNDNENGAKDNLIRSYQSNFRDDIKAFNDELHEAYTIENSPYLEALVVVDGKVVDDDDIVVKKNNNVITYVSNEYKIYLPLDKIDGMTEKDVTDKIRYKNRIYVNSSYVNIYE